MERALAGILAAVFACGPVCAGGEEWVATAPVGGFPMVEPFRASFRIGWTEIAAAEARAEITSNATVAKLSAGGGTIGLARSLYQLDATLEAESALPDFETVGSEQLEKYRRRTLLTAVEESDGNLRTKRGWTDGSEELRWKPVKVSPARDLFSAMMFIRSQPLNAGDKVGVVVFPGESPFFVEMESLGERTISVGGAGRRALLLELRISRINTKKGNALEPHPKFRTGRVWLSNDADRIPLRAEVEIFIGYLFAEIASFEKIPRP